MAARPTLTTAYRWRVASRCAAAAVGGFVLASAVSIVLALLAVRLGWSSRASATQAATLLSFALWCGVAMWAFHTPQLSRVWWNLVLPSVALGALAWWLGSVA